MNNFRFLLTTEGRALKVLDAKPILEDPESGVVIERDHDILVLPDPPFSVESVQYKYGPEEQFSYWVNDPRGGYSLKYFPPSSEWRNILEIRLLIRPEARGMGEIPLRLSTSSRSVVNFHPYPQKGSKHSGTVFRVGCEDTWWMVYDETDWIPGKVSILGGGDPPPGLDPPLDPDEADIRFSVGDPVIGQEPSEPPAEVVAERGDTIEIPVFVATGVPLWKLRMVLGFDNTQLEFLGFDVDFIDSDGDEFSKFLDRNTPEPFGIIVENLECVDLPPPEDRQCQPGLFPFIAMLYDTRWEVPADSFIVDVFTVYKTARRDQGGIWFYEPERTYRIGRIRLKVRDDAWKPSTEISGTEVLWSSPWSPEGEKTTSVSAGFPFLDDRDDRVEREDVPARWVQRSVVRISGIVAETFLRGDANKDNILDIGDPILVLGRLFLGSVLTCEDAADANDDGELDLSDAVFSLVFQFLGTVQMPPPFPTPGEDPTDDALRCE